MSKQEDNDIRLNMEAAIMGGRGMDALVKSALERVQETVNHIPWKTLEEVKGKSFMVVGQFERKN